MWLHICVCSPVLWTGRGCGQTLVWFPRALLLVWSNIIHANTHTDALTHTALLCSDLFLRLRCQNSSFTIDMQVDVAAVLNEVSRCYVTVKSHLTARNSHNPFLYQLWFLRLDSYYSTSPHCCLPGGNKTFTYFIIMNNSKSCACFWVQLLFQLREKIIIEKQQIECRESENRPKRSSFITVLTVSLMLSWRTASLMCHKRRSWLDFRDSSKPTECLKWAQQKH